MRPGVRLTPAIKDQITAAIRTALSPRHVPRYLIQVSDIPVTINGKKVELAVKRLISGQDVKLSATVSNPESLSEYEKYRDWEEKPAAKL
jgi:acetoacetyl-CoA synthetase